MVPASPLSTQVSVRNVEVVDDVCRSAFGCWGVDLATVALVLLTGVLAVVVLATAVHVHRAVSLVDEERTRLADERDAFDAFSRRLAAMEVAEAGAPVTAAGGLATATTTTAPSDGLDRVRSSYRETVMAVPHYETDYGEPLAENLAAEFGDGLAYAVLEGRTLTPQLKSALLEASRQASRSRSGFLSTLESESEALAAAAAELEAIDDERAGIAAPPLTQRSYEGLVADWERLHRLEDRCQSLLRNRQEHLGTGSPSDGSDEPDLPEYLYRELPVGHPVLADGLALSAAVDDLRSRVLRSITRRV